MQQVVRVVRGAVAPAVSVRMLAERSSSPAERTNRAVRGRGRTSTAGGALEFTPMFLTKAELDTAS